MCLCQVIIPEKATAGDVLVHAGDFTNKGTLAEVESFAAWFGGQPHAIKIVVPGNHDMIMDVSYYEEYWSDWGSERVDPARALAALHKYGIHVLFDTTLELPPAFGGLRVHGSPWVRGYAVRYVGWRCFLIFLPSYNRHSFLVSLLTSSPPHIAPPDVQDRVLHPRCRDEGAVARQRAARPWPTCLCGTHRRVGHPYAASWGRGS